MNKKMRRAGILIFFLFFTIPLAYSQAALIILLLGDKVATEEFHLSMDAGMNISTFPGLNNDERGIGVNFGLGTHIKLGENWHLKPEFKPLSRKIADDVISLSQVPEDLNGEKNRIALNYIDVPVFLQYNITPKIFVSAGPQVSFLTKANQFTTGKLEDGSESTLKSDIKPLFNTVNFSFPVEFGYLIKLATKHSTTKMDINLFARYEYDFLEIFKDASLNSSKISMFQIGASVPFVKTSDEQMKN